MTPAPTISVVVPTYNRRELVSGAVRCVLAQTHEDFELLVVDDGSTDDTVEHLCATFGGDERVRVLTKTNGGSASARNLGTEHARGEYMAFLDSDDRWTPRYLESQLAFARAHPEADLVLCDAKYVGGKYDGTTVFSRDSWETPDSIDVMCRYGWALPSCMFMPMRIARMLPWAVEFPYAEDTALLFDFNDRGLRLVENPEVLAMYCTHDGSEGEPQKVTCEESLARDHIALLESFVDRTSAENRASLQKRVLCTRRTLAKAMVRDGRLREARPHLLAWWRYRPLRLRPAWLYLTSFFRGRPA